MTFDRSVCSSAQTEQRERAKALSRIRARPVLLVFCYDTGVSHLRTAFGRSPSSTGSQFRNRESERALLCTKAEVELGDKVRTQRGAGGNVVHFGRSQKLFSVARASPAQRVPRNSEASKRATRTIGRFARRHRMCGPYEQKRRGTAHRETPSSRDVFSFCA